MAGMPDWGSFCGDWAGARLTTAPPPVEYRGSSSQGRQKASAQQAQHSTVLCHTPAHTTCAAPMQGVTSEYRVRSPDMQAAQAHSVAHHTSDVHPPHGRLHGASTMHKRCSIAEQDSQRDSSLVGPMYMHRNFPGHITGSFQLAASR